MGTELKIDKLSLFAAGCGGNGICCHAYYSTDNFETRTTIFEMKKMPANNPQYIEATPVVTLKEGEQLLVRIYPWYNGAASGKTICLSDLTIHGMAMEATGISNLKAAAEKGNKPIYDLQGRQVAADSLSATSLKKGIYIINGKKTVVK